MSPEYKEVFKLINEDSYHWYKIQYSDQCTPGDIIINNILDELYNLYMGNINETLIKNDIPDNYPYFEHIIDFYKRYENGMYADPNWAS
jgi:hypothetical protein